MLFVCRTKIIIIFFFLCAGIPLYVMDSKTQLDLLKFQRNDERFLLQNTKNKYEDLLKGLPAITDHYFYKAGLIFLENSDQKKNNSFLNYSVQSGVRIPLCVNEMTVDGEKKLFQYNGYNLLRRTVINQNWKNNDRVLLVCVHGTSSDDKSFGADDTMPTTQAIILFAKKLAHVYQSFVDILSFTWSGALTQTARQEAGAVLAKEVLLKELEQHDVHKIWVLGHSYGCAVLHHAAVQMRGKRPIDYGLLIASPISTDILSVCADEPEFIPELVSLNNAFNFKKLYHFYSSDDMTQAFGSIFGNNSGYKGRLRKWPVRISYVNNGGSRRVWNIRLQACIKKEGQKLLDKGIDHVNIKLFTLLALPEMIALVDTKYPAHFDLEAHVPLLKKNGAISLLPDKMPLVAIRTEEYHCLEYLKKKYVYDLVAHGILGQSKEHSQNVKKDFEKTYNREMSAKNGGGLWEYVPRNMVVRTWGELKSSGKNY